MLRICIALLSLFLITNLYASSATTTNNPLMKKPAATANITYADVNRPIMVTQNAPHFVIKLAANPTTGYQWFYLPEKSDGLAVPVKQEYIAPDVKMPGAGGFSVWHFEVDPAAFKVPTISRVTLIYARGFEMAEPIKILELKVITQ